MPRQYRRRPLIIFDTSVVLHRLIDFTIDKSSGQILNPLTDHQLYQKIKDGVDLYNTLYFLPGIDTSRCDILWAGDSLDGYWRRHWFKNYLDNNPEYVETLRSKFTLDPQSGEYLPKSTDPRRKNLILGYKANRKSHPYVSLGKRMINQISKAVVFDQYEADDVAAAVCQMFPSREIILCTIDTDWLQLVNDRVSWVCLRGFDPQYRDVEGGMEWFNRAVAKGNAKTRQEFSDLTSLRQIVDWKMFSGDSSDNLPAGSPREMIDLINPPDSFKIWNDPLKQAVVHSSIVRAKTKRQCLKVRDQLFDHNVWPTTPLVRGVDWSLK